MYLWSPDSLSELRYPVTIANGSQAGIAMVISLILLLVITAMGLGIAYVATMQSDLVDAVANKPVSIEAADTCFDHALEWLTKPAGLKWVNGQDEVLDLAASGGPLAGKTLLGDTSPFNPPGDLTNRMGRAGYSKCIVQKLKSDTNDSGNEIGTSNGYGSSNYVYLISITAQGDYNVPLGSDGAIDKRFWQSGSSRTIVESVVQYTP